MHTGKPECHLVHNLLKSLMMKIPISTESALLSERTDAPFPLGLASPCSLRHFSGPMMIQEPTGEACCREGTTKAKTECIFSPVYSSLCESCGRPGLWHKGLCWHK